MPTRRSYLGCFSSFFIIALIPFSIAWFGLGAHGSFRGLRVIFSPDLVRTTGIVIRNVGGGTSSHPSVHAVVEVPNGRTSFEFAAVGSATRDFEVGDRVPVAYINGHPETAFIRTFGQQFAVPLLFVLFGLAPFALALRAIQMMIRYWNNPEG